MPDATACTICDPAQGIADALEVRQIHSNVRRFQHETFTVWRCPQCRSLHSKEAVNLDDYYAHYPLQNHRIDSITRLAYQNRVRSLKKHGLKPDHTILDYGCGQGVFVEFLLEQGYANKAQGYDAYVPAYADKTVLAATYDTITAYDVIEHVDDPRAFLRQIAEYLRAGGLLALGTPAADQIDLSDQETFISELHQPYHRHILSEPALLDLGREAGLKVIKVDHRYYFDTLYPFVNARFGKAYLRRIGNVMDALLEKQNPDVIFKSPRLLFYAFFGYLFPPKGNITVFFRKM
jgi:2-polyprenyl-3-methyl-5-hydroxy-6-metoxy-1,4-benzoquinol methylase